MELYNDEGEVWLPAPENYPSGGGAVVAGSFRQDALDVLSLDPQKIIDEFGRMQAGTRTISRENSEVVDAFRMIDYSVQDWQGKGADAFREHVSRLDAFLAQQVEYGYETLKSLGILLGVAVHLRRDYCALAGATVGACQKAMKQNQEAETKFVIGLGTTLVGALASVASGGSLLGVSVGAFIAAGGSGIQMAVEGEKAGDVLGSYTSSRKQLMANYEAVVGEAGRILSQARERLAAERNELFEPLPVSIDVNSPSFHYGDFSSPEQPSGGFGEKVDQQRYAPVAEGDGTIRKLLDG